MSLELFGRYLQDPGAVVFIQEPGPVRDVTVFRCVFTSLLRFDLQNHLGGRASWQCCQVGPRETQ